MAPIRSKKRVNGNSLPVPGSYAHQQLSLSDVALDLDLDLDPDSDFPITTAAALPKPPLRTNEDLNLQVLQRLNREITTIVSLASHAVVYTFSPTTRGWEKTSVEGTMFVVRLTPHSTKTQESIGTSGGMEERYAVFVLNRRGLDNFMLELRTEDDVDITDEYVIFQETEDAGDGTGRQEVVVYGLWIFAEKQASIGDARTFNAQVILQCATQANTARRRAEQERLFDLEEQENARVRVEAEQEREKARYAEALERENARVAAEWEADQARQAAQHQMFEQQRSAAFARKSELLDLFKRPSASTPNTHPPDAQTQLNLLDLFKKPTPSQQSQTIGASSGFINAPTSSLSQLGSNQDHIHNHSPANHENRSALLDPYHQSVHRQEGQTTHPWPQHQPNAQHHPLAYSNPNQQQPSHRQQFAPQQHYNQQPLYHPQPYPQTQQPSNPLMHSHNQNQQLVGDPQSHRPYAPPPPPPGLNYSQQPGSPYSQAPIQSQGPHHSQGPPFPPGFSQGPSSLRSADLFAQPQTPGEHQFAQRFLGRQ